MTAFSLQLYRHCPVGAQLIDLCQKVQVPARVASELVMFLSAKAMTGDMQAKAPKLSPTAAIHKLWRAVLLETEVWDELCAYIGKRVPYSTTPTEEPDSEQALHKARTGLVLKQLYSYDLPDLPEELACWQPVTATLTWRLHREEATVEFLMPMISAEPDRSDGNFSVEDLVTVIGMDPAAGLEQLAMRVGDWEGMITAESFAHLAPVCFHTAYMFGDEEAEVQIREVRCRLTLVGESSISIVLELDTDAGNRRVAMSFPEEPDYCGLLEAVFKLIGPVTFQMICRGQVLADDQACRELDDGDVVRVHQEAGEWVALSVKLLTGRTIVLERVFLDVVVYGLKVAIQNESGIGVDQQRLIFNNRILKDFKTLREVGVMADSEIFLIYGLRGC